MSPEDPILERVLKLLRLAADSAATPEEAETAAAMASKLMFKHQIDQARVYARQQASGTRAAQSTDLYGQEFVTITKSASWERELLSWLVSIYDCNMYYTSNKWRFEVLGHKDNVRMVATMHQWLVKELGRLASAAYKRNRPRNDLDGGLHMDPFRFHVSFKRGAVTSVVGRLQAQKAAQETEVRANSEGALLVITQQIRDGALAHFHPYMKGWYDAKYGIQSAEAAKELETREFWRKRAEEDAKKPQKKERVRRGRMPKTYEVKVSGKAYAEGRIAGETVRLNTNKELK